MNAPARFISIVCASLALIAPAGSFAAAVGDAPKTDCTDRCNFARLAQGAPAADNGRPIVNIPDKIPTIDQGSIPNKIDAPGGSDRVLSDRERKEKAVHETEKNELRDIYKDAIRDNDAVVIQPVP